MIPKKPAPDLIRGGYRFSDKIMPSKSYAASRMRRTSGGTASSTSAVSA